MSSKPGPYSDGKSEFDELRNIIVGAEPYAREQEFHAFKEEVFGRLDQLEKRIEDRIAFEAKLVKSKSKMVDVISPQMGQIIRASVTLKIQELQDQIASTSRKFSNLFGLKPAIKKMLGMEVVEKHIFIDYPKIIQLFIIEQDTGLLIGKFEKERIADPDLMTGILTSVKAFAESSLAVNDAQIGMIDYGQYFIKMFNYGTYYFALVMTGTPNPDFEHLIAEEIDAFAHMHTGYLIDKERVNIDFDQEINTYFKKTCEKLEKR